MSSFRVLKFDENRTRVTLSGLVARGPIENFKRGLYRLTKLSDSITEFIQELRLGESKIRHWGKGHF
jgi:hypothetical protein